MSGDQPADLRERFLQRTKTGQGIDWLAMLTVHERGWTHSHDDDVRHDSEHAWTDGQNDSQDAAADE